VPDAIIFFAARQNEPTEAIVPGGRRAAAVDQS
jgi:hypothetical protein